MWSLVDNVPARYRALVLLIAATGMRQGEALGLTVDRIDFLRRQVHIDRQLLANPRRPVELGPTKTASSVRSVPLPGLILDELAAHIQTYPPGTWGLVFTNKRGLPVVRATWHKGWVAAVKASGVPQVTTVHLLRHTYASRLIEGGENVKTVQMRLGHANAMETFNTYSHLFPAAHERTRKVVEDAFSRGDDEQVADESEEAEPEAGGDVG